MIPAIAEIGKIGIIDREMNNEENYLKRKVKIKINDVKIALFK